MKTPKEVAIAPVKSSLGAAEATEPSDVSLRDIHVSALLAAALLAQVMSNGPDVVLTEAIAALVGAKKDGHGFVRAKSTRQTVDFLRHPDPRAGRTYFKPVSSRAREFCARPAVHGLLMRPDLNGKLITDAGIVTITWHQPPELAGWYEFEWQGHAERMHKVDPPFTDTDADPFAQRTR